MRGMLRLHFHESSICAPARAGIGFSRLVFAAASYSAHLRLRHSRNACGVVSYITMTLLNGQSRLFNALCLTSSNPRVIRVMKSSTAFSARKGSSGGIANHTCNNALLVELRPILHIHLDPQISKRLHPRFHLGRVDHPESVK